MSKELDELLKILDHNTRPTLFYHSVLDPEGKVITEEGPGGTKIHITDKKLWEAYVSNTWIKPEQVLGEKIKKPRGSPRIDYNKENYCARCRIKYPGKEKLRCSDCGNRLRTKPWHGRSNFANGGRY